jgi:hypothetical protein
VQVRGQGRDELPVARGEVVGQREARGAEMRRRWGLAVLEDEGFDFVEYGALRLC